MADDDRTREPQDERGDENREHAAEQPGPRHEADKSTQQDAGLTGGQANAERGETVGDD